MGCKKCNGIIIPEALRGIPGPAGPVGPAGDASTVPGPTGPIGTTRLLMFSGANSDANIASWENLLSYTLPADSLETDGDSVLIKANISQANRASSTATAAKRRITIDSQNCTSTGSAEASSVYNTGVFIIGERLETQVEIIKLSNTTALCKYSWRFGMDGANLPIVGEKEITLSTVGFDEDAVITFDIYQYIANDITLNSLTIDLIKIL